MNDRMASRASIVRSLCDLESNLTIPVTRSGSVRRDRSTYLPLVRAGSRSVVAEVTSDRRQALKCYLRPDAERARQTADVAPALLDLAPSGRGGGVVGLELFSDALTVGDHTVDVMVMPWVEGANLASWLRTHCDDAERVAAVAASFAEVVGRLAQAGVVHGDLQDSSVFVTPDDAVVLVDLDAARLVHRPDPLPAWAPHPAFGPARVRSEGGDDRYSAWTIYASLIAITFDADLVRRIPGALSGRLLLGPDDHADLASGPVVSMLRGHPAAEIRTIAAVLRSIAATAVADIPLLDVDQVPEPPKAGWWSASAPAELIERRREVLAEYEAECEAIDRAAQSRLATVRSRRRELAEAPAAETSAEELAQHHLADELAGRVPRTVLDALEEVGIATAADVTWDGAIATESIRVGKLGRKKVELSPADRRVIGLWTSGLQSANRTNLDPASIAERLRSLTDEESEILRETDALRAKARAVMSAKLGNLRPRVGDEPEAPTSPLSARGRPLPAAPS